MNDRDWLIKHLKPLMDAGKQVNDIDKNLPSKIPTYDKGYWTALKLISLKYYIPSFIDILKSRNKKIAYIDLFSGPGLNLLGNTKTPVIGSPLVPMTAGKNRSFDCYIFNDKNKTNTDSLKTRLISLTAFNQSKVILDSKDANKFVTELPQMLKANGIDFSLIFIDPEGMEMKWESIRFLSDEIMCDFVINFPSTGIARNQHNMSTVTNFLGPGSDKIPSTNIEEWSIDLYRKNLADIGKDISTEIAVIAGDKKSFHYHLIPAVRKTFAASPWFPKIFGGLKNRVEKCSGSTIKAIAEQIDGRQASFDIA